MKKQRGFTPGDVVAIAVMSLATVLPAQATNVSVPEPGSLALFGAGLGAAILVARIWNKK